MKETSAVTSWTSLSMKSNRGWIVEEVNLDALALLHDGDGQHRLSLHDVIVHDENLERNSEGI